MRSVLPVLVLAVVACLPCAADDVLDVAIVVSPNVLNLESNGVWVTVHAEIAYARVDGISVEINEIPVAFVKSDSRGELVAKFRLDDVKKILKPGRNDLTLTGRTVDNLDFRGADEILVIQQTGRR